MALYSPESLGIKPPPTGFQEGGWYAGRQYIGGTLGDPGVIHPNSKQIGAGQAVSQEVNNQSAAAQGVSPDQFNAYLAEQRKQTSANRAAASDPFGQASGTGTDGAGVAGGIGIPAAPQATLDLPSLYKNLYDTSGISDKQAKLSEDEKAYAAAQSTINDNPFLGEATRLGRLKKLQMDYDNSTANLRNDIATTKADIEMKLNLQTKQFDINSQAAQQALNQFNNLLQSGALEGASGQDIANITRSTGLSSSMIQSAIKANKAKNMKTQTIQFDDGSSQGFAIINSDTGEIISKQSVSVSKPKAASVSDQKTNDLQQTQSNLVSDIQRGVTLRDVVDHYVVPGGMSLEDVYRIYNSNSPYGQAKEELKDVKIGKFNS